MKITYPKLLTKNSIYKSLRNLGIKSNCFNTYFYDVRFPELGGFVLDKITFYATYFYIKNKTVMLATEEL